MAVEGQIPTLGYQNGADDQFDYISENNPASADAITLPAPVPGETTTVSIPPGTPIRAEFDMGSTEVSGDGSQVQITMPDGSVIILQSPEPGAFTDDPPILMTPKVPSTKPSPFTVSMGCAGNSHRRTKEFSNSGRPAIRPWSGIR